MATLTVPTDVPTPFAVPGPAPKEATRTALSRKADEYMAEALAKYDAADLPEEQSTVKIECGRCLGNQKFVQWSHIAKGDCFGCGGTGYVHVPVKRIRRWARQDALQRAREVLNADLYEWESYVAMLNEVIAEREKQTARYAREKARKDALVPGFVAEIGEKVDVEVTIASTKVIETRYGRSMLVVGTAADGRCIKTFGTGSTLYGLNKGDRVRWQATVKGHDTFRDQDQTVTTRTKLEVLERAEQEAEVA